MKHPIATTEQDEICPLCDAGDLKAPLLVMCKTVLEILVNNVDKDQHFYREKLITNLRQTITKAEGGDK